MIRILGFLLLIVGLMVVLRFSMFKEIFEKPTENTEEVTLKDSNRSGANGEFTAYAEGYDDEDFGEAFQAPSDEMFPLDEEGNLQSPGGVWDVLLELEFDIQYQEEFGDVVFKPMFTKEIKALEGKEIEVTGFIVPSDIVATAMGESGANGDMFMLSAFPAASCFFCGGSGPESIMEVYPDEPIPYSKETVTLKGKLKLNGTDYLRMPYFLEDAHWVEE